MEMQLYRFDIGLGVSFSTLAFKAIIEGLSQNAIYKWPKFQMEKTDFKSWPLQNLTSILQIEVGKLSLWYNLNNVSAWKTFSNVKDSLTCFDEQILLEFHDMISLVLEGFDAESANDLHAPAKWPNGWLLFSYNRSSW